jgi:glycosyltransferase involved in cell wall biosynthesis
MSERSNTLTRATKVRCPTLDELPSPPAGRTDWPWTEQSPQLPSSMPDGHPWPRVSIVTPSYNQGQFIEETIRSVLLQGYPELEYIVIDAGSTDESVSIIRRYEPWLEYWTSEPDRGQTHAINKGWKRSTGDVLAYINTDDCYLSGAITTAAQEFSSNRNLGMVYGTAVIVNEANKELRSWDAKDFDVRVMLTSGSIVPQPAAFFSRGAINTAGYLNEEWQMIMDYESCIRIGTQFPAVCVPRTLAKFRNHPQSKTQLQFERLARELVHFVTRFSTDQISPPEWQMIKNVTLSRVYYELALAYVVQGEEEGIKALRQLLRSIVLHPQFALKQPMLTAYITKGALFGQLKRIGVPITDLLRGISW